MPLPHARVWLQRILVGVIAAGCVTLLVLRALTWPLDTWLYDRMLGSIDQPVDDRIVLVVVDEKSLAALGRWPWSRGVHAALLQTLSTAKPRGIAFDLLFSEPSHEDAAGDIALAQAMTRSGRVVSPVAAEASQPDGTLIEVLPMSSLIEASASLGHVEVDADPDGLARQAYLYAGLGSAHWPALALALRDLDPEARQRGPLPGLRNPLHGAPASPFVWARDYRIMVPYARGEGFQQISYLDALHGTFDPALLRDRWLLVGVTASGIAREVLVPDAGGSHRIPGVEYHAHLLNALLRNDAIVPMPTGAQLLCSIVLVLMPLGIHRSRHRIRRPWVSALVPAALALLVSVLLLHHARLWFAPAPAILVLAAGYIAWLLLRLRRSQRLADSDGLTQLANRRLFDLTLERELAAARRSNRPLSLLLIDVDHFKTYNDHYGHQAGDAVLRKVAGTIVSWARRPRDLAARYGGDEMALLLPESSANAAATIARKILDDIHAQSLPHAVSSSAAHVSLSIGIATYYPILEGHDIDLVKRADAALYRAKREGRNRIVVSAEGGE